MTTTEVFNIDGKQAIKLPAEFHFDSDTVSIRREGTAIILEPLHAAEPLSATWPDGFFELIRIDDPNFTRPNQGQMPPAPSFDKTL